MAIYRAICSHTWTDSLPKDTVVNVLHFQASTGANTAALNELAGEVATAFHSKPQWSTRGVHVKMYDLGQTKPRQIVGESIIAPTGIQANMGNGDVALCLSFYAGRNLPRQRGRIYTGPFEPNDAGNYKPTTALMNNVLGLAGAFAAAGEDAFHWCVYSPTNAEAYAVTNAYVDDEWDTQRRRGHKPDLRVTAAVAG
jgi:hypothetical protein